jgi:hypothetical protein
MAFIGIALYDRGYDLRYLRWGIASRPRVHRSIKFCLHSIVDSKPELFFNGIQDYFKELLKVH